jgi:uncharacterized protein (DUF58 family)
VLTIRRSARMSGGLLRANRASKRVGAGLEFADHRDYAPGDDLRYLDWNLYGRLGRLALRLFQEEEDLLVEVLVDASASMGFGEPPKLDLALQIGAAMAYVGLANLDRVAVSPLGDEDAPLLPPARGKGAILPILRFLGGVRAEGRVGLASAVRAFLSRRRRRRRGLAIVISDFYDPAGYRAALDLLRHHRLEVVAIQVSAPQELAPALHGDVELRDVETGEARELTISPSVLAAYRRRHQALLHDPRGLLPRARPALLHRRLRPAVRRRRPAHVPRGRTAALTRMDLARLLSDPLPARVATAAAAAGTVAITILYFVRLRRRRVVVPFAPLWLDASGPRQTTSWARHLRNLLSLLLALVLLHLILLATVDPRASAAAAGGRNLVVLIDRSASMSARDAAGTRLHAARARATAIVDGLGPADRALVASFAADTVAEIGFEADAGRLRRAVAAVAPSEEPGDLPRALTFAAAVLRGRPRPTVVLISDGAFSDEARRAIPADLDVRYAAIGHSQTCRTARRQRRHRLVRRAPRARRSERRRSGAGRAELRRPARVGRRRHRRGRHHRRARASGSSPRRAPPLRAAQRLRRRRAPARSPARRRRPAARRHGRRSGARRHGVRGRAAPPPPPRAARRRAPTCTSTARCSASARRSPSSGSRCRSPRRSARAGRTTTWWCSTASRPRRPHRGPIPVPRRARARQPVPRARHGPRAGDRRRPPRPPAGAPARSRRRQHLVGAAARARTRATSAVAGSFGVPLLIARERPGLRIAATSFDPRHSDLPMRPAYPLLIANALSWAPGPRLDAATEAPPALLTGASARPREDLPEIAIAHVGFHRVGDLVLAANLGDVRESDTAPAPELELGGRKLAPPDPPAWRGRLHLSTVALWLALALLLAECVSYHRRWTT